MAILDIRNTSASTIDRIQWEDGCYVDGSFDVGKICIADEYGGGFDINKRDIDNLIKALQKAKELWLDKT